MGRSKPLCSGAISQMGASTQSDGMLPTPVCFRPVKTPCADAGRPSPRTLPIVPCPLFIVCPFSIVQLSGCSPVRLRQRTYGHTASLCDLNDQFTAVKQRHTKKRGTLCLIHSNPSRPAMPRDGGLVDIEDAVTAVGQHSPPPPTPDKAQLLNKRCRKRQETVETCIDNRIDLPLLVPRSPHIQRDDGLSGGRNMAGYHAPLAL